jgi:hypothetical protein
MNMEELTLIVNGLILALNIAKEVHDLFESPAVMKLENEISVLMDFIERKKKIGLEPIMEDIAPSLDDTAHNNE